jgi:hypothetical protein
MKRVVHPPVVGESLDHAERGAGPEAVVKLFGCQGGAM